MKLIYFAVVFISLGLVRGIPLKTEIREWDSQAGLFDVPQVFLTLCALAGVIDNKYQDTLFELNWANFPAPESGDWIGIFNVDPSTNHPLPQPLASVLASYAGNNQTGYFKTNVRFGRPAMNYSSDGDNCLGYWIAYLNSENQTKLTNCFRKYPQWMNELSGIIGDVPLHSLMIPGTHDAGAIREYDGHLSEDITVKYSVCQEEQLYRQFLHGIRYVDIRVAHYPSTVEKFWINHGNARFAPLITLFDAVKRFVAETKEIIFMDFHGFPVGMANLTQHNQLLEFVQAQVGSLLVHKSMVGAEFTNVTANQLWKLNRTVILTYQREDIGSQHDFLWPYLIHAWGDKNTVPPLEEYFEKEAFSKYGCSGKFWSAMAEMTPRTADAIGNPRKGLRGFAQEVNIPLTYWWQRPHWYSRSMIVSTDFFLGNNIVEMSVEANRNRAICKAAEFVTSTEKPADSAGSLTTYFNIWLLITLIISSLL
jgi:hypothetical protein